MILALASVLFALVGQGCAELGPSGGLGLIQDVLSVTAVSPTSGDSADGTPATTTVVPSPVNGVQSGTATMSAATVNVTVTAVDTTKSFVHCFSRTDNSNAAQMPTCTLSSSTQVTIQVGETNANTQVKWYVVEFSSGAVVQTGARTLGAGVTSGNVTLPTSVDTSKSFALVTARTTDTSQSIDEQRTVIGRLTGTTTLEISRNESGIAVDIVWQVIELSGASVQSGLTTIAGGNTSATAAITSVDTASTFLIAGMLGSSGINGVDGEYFARAALFDSTTIAFNRLVTTNSTDVAWYAVTMADGAAVRTGSVSTTGHTETQLDATITAVVTSRAVPFVNCTVSGGGSADQDSALFVPSLTSTTNLRMTRNSAQDRPSTCDYSVVEFTAP